MPAGGRSALGGRLLLLVDAELVFAEVLRLRLEPLGCEVLIAQGAAEASALATRRRPDLVLAAARLGDGSALDLLDSVRSLDRPPALVVMSDDHDPTAVVRALELGAGGWILKDDSVTELIAACGAALAGEMYLSRDLVRPVVEHLMRRREHVRTWVDDLTHREREVLECLVDGLDRQQVAVRLSLSTNTVRTHVQNLLRTAQVHTTVALVAAARSAGLGSAPDERTPRAGHDRPSA